MPQTLLRIAMSAILAFGTEQANLASAQGIDPALLTRFQTEASAGWDRIEAVHATSVHRGIVDDLLWEKGRGEVEYEEHGLAIICRRKPGFFLIETIRPKIIRARSRGESACVINPAYSFIAHKVNAGDAAWFMGEVKPGENLSGKLHISLITQLGAYIVPFRFHPTLTNREFFLGCAGGLSELSADLAKPHLIRAKFTYTIPEDPQHKSIYGTAVFDPAQNWEMTEAEVRIGKSSAYRRVEYRDDGRSGLRTYFTVLHTLAQPDRVNRRTYTVTEFDAAPPPDGAFMLAAYGLAEKSIGDSESAEPTTARAPAAGASQLWIVLPVAALALGAALAAYLHRRRGKKYPANHTWPKQNRSSHESPQVPISALK